MIVICIILAVTVCVLAFFCVKFSSKASENAANAASLKASFTAGEERLKAALAAAEERLNDEKEASARRIEDINAAYERQIAGIREDHAARIAAEREAVGERFQALAAQVLQSNSQQLDQRSRASVEAVLTPMKTQLEEFTKGFRECYSVESRDRLTMREEIKRLHELSLQVGAETARLTHALKGNTRMQGQWGEMVLQNILEHSGLEMGEWFVTQDHNSTDDGGSVRPDAVIHCPGDRDIIIDSKASLKSYFEYLDSDSDEERDRLIKAHVRSVENHIKTLREKDYQSKVGARKGDFVFMFMPHEGAFIAAMRAKPDLWQNAFDSHVVLASPTHLITILQLVEQMWKAEKQSVNSQKIAEQGTKMLDSLNAFLSDLTSVGDSLQKAQKTYDSAVRRLREGNNNVMRVATRLGELGVKSKKALPSSFSDLE